jgi:hemoglobin
MSCLNDELVALVIDAFYTRLRSHSTLGPVFNEIIGAKWDQHLAKINLFWCTTLGIRRGYPAQDFMPAHIKQLSIQASHIPIWLDLFETTIDEMVPEDHKAIFLKIARAMAENLAIGLERRDAALGELNPRSR